MRATVTVIRSAGRSTQPPQREVVAFRPRRGLTVIASDITGMSWRASKCRGLQLPFEGVAAIEDEGDFFPGAARLELPLDVSHRRSLGVENSRSPSEHSGHVSTWRVVRIAKTTEQQSRKKRGREGRREGGWEGGRTDGGSERGREGVCLFEKNRFAVPVLVK